MSKARAGALLALVVLLFPQDGAGLGAPHDASNGIGCADCHAIHGEGPGGGGLLPSGEWEEATCRSCHNPTGIAASMSRVGRHRVGDGPTILGCGACHDVHSPRRTLDPHDGTTAPNLALLRGDMRPAVPAAATPTVFHARPGDFAFGDADPPWVGACQVCHTATVHHTSDASGDHAHFLGASCTSCHPHDRGFEPSGGCFACHDRPQGARRPVVGPAGDFALASHHLAGEPTEADCTVCHALGSHGAGTVRLRHPDDAGTVLAFDPVDPTSLVAFCAGCHDADGSRAGGGRQPFSDGRVVPDVTGEGGARWAEAAHGRVPYAPNGDRPLSCYGDGSTSGCHANAHGAEARPLLALAAAEPIDTLCLACHRDGGVTNPSLDGTVSDIATAFGKAEHHDLGAAFAIDGRSYTLSCTTCHNPHLVTGAHAEGVAGRTPVTRPDLTADPAGNPRAMGGEIWGDEPGERMAAYAGGGTYRTPNGDLLSGEEMPDYATFCLDCHGRSGAPPFGIDWSRDPHGLVSANVPNGGGACPNWYGCGKGAGWDGDDCVGDEDQCWPVLPRGRGEQIFSRGPFLQEERIAGANFVLACIDCHEAHGADRGSFVRERLNENESGACGTGSEPGQNCTDGSNWNSFCNICHYYYSDWHAGMSCGNASCHVSSRMNLVGSTPHGMSNASGAGGTRVFDPDLVADLRFDGNLRDAGTWRMHARWFDTAGAFVPGRSGSAIELDGDQCVELGSENEYWSTDEGRHGTWKYTEMKYAMTLAAWVYPTDDALAEYVLGAKHTYTDGGYAFLLRGGGALRAALLVNVNGGGEADVWDPDCNGLRGAFSSVRLPLHRWSHVAAVYDSARPDRDPGNLSVGRVRIFVDGEDVTTSASFTSGECYAQPGPGEETIFSYSMHSPEGEARCYAGHWCGSAFSAGGLMWGSGSRKGLIGRLDELEVWNVVKDAAYFDSRVGPTIRAAEGAVGSERLLVFLSEGVWGALGPEHLVLVDAGNDNPRTVVGVEHVAGEALAVVTMGGPLLASDVGADTLAGVGGTAITDDFGNPLGTDPAVIEDASCPAGDSGQPTPTVIALDEPAGSLTATDTQGVLDGLVSGEGVFLGDGYFHGDGATSHVLFDNPDCLAASDRLLLSARLRPAVVDDGEEVTISRVFAKAGGGGNYQLSVWRNETWADYAPPDGVGSFAFWVRVRDPGDGPAWKPVLTDYTRCPLVAGHWYEVTVDWDSGRTDGIPCDIVVDDQGPGGDDVGELWPGRATCADRTQGYLPEERWLVAGDEILPAPQAPVIGAEPADLGLNFLGLIDWIVVETP